MLDNLIGSQILKIDGNKIEAKKDEKVYTLEISSDYGDCCGYANFTAELLYLENSERNPIITNVEYTQNEYYDGDSSVITFYGESQPLAMIDSNASSGSGYGYGAFVTLICNELDIDESLAYW